MVPDANDYLVYSFISTTGFKYSIDSKMDNNIWLERNISHAMLSPFPKPSLLQ